MTKELYLRQAFEIISIERSKEVIVNHEFSGNEDAFNIRLVVSEDLKEIEAETRFQISEELSHTIQSHLINNEPFVNGRQEQIDGGIAKAQQSLIKAVHKLVDLMEFESGYLFLNENLRQGNCYCSLDGECWENVNKREFTAYLSFSWDNIPGLSESERLALQRHIDNNVEPFLATHHLFKATKETDPRHQLINLATALELGIKEYLDRKKPEIEVLIQNLPSPPLDKLYGEVLESFAGKKTPVKTDIIRQISKRRNELVHTVIRPDKVNLNNDFIKKYQAATKIALFHLWLGFISL